MNPDEPDPLDPRDEQVAARLAVGRTYAEAAAELNVSVSTVQRAARRPDVRARVRELQLEAVGAVTAVFVAAGRGAAAELVRLAGQGKRDEVVRLRAAVAVIEFIYKFGGVANLEAEVAELRAMLAGLAKPVGGADADDPQ